VKDRKTVDRINVPETTLSDLLLAIRVSRADAVLFEIGGDHGLHFPRRWAIFHLVLSGRIMLDDERTPAVLLEIGDCVFLVRGTPHRLVFSDCGRPCATHHFDASRRFDVIPVMRIGDGEMNCRVLSVSFDIGFSETNPLIRLLPDIIHLKRKDAVTSAHADWHGDFNGIEEACHGPGGAGFVTRLADMILVQAIRSRILEVNEWLGMDAKLAVTSPRILAAMAIIHGRPDFGWSVGSLAREVGMSRSSFAAAFANSIGVPPLQYVKRLRATRALHLLRSTRLSVSEIAREVGYTSEDSFARVFRRIYGKTPSASRGAN